MDYIRKATLEDAINICNIANSNSLKNLKRSNLKNGFLVSKFTVEEYEEYIRNNTHFYVLVNEGKVCAFLLGYTREELDIDLNVNKKILQHSNNDFVVIKQICVDTNSYRKGYATKLYKYFDNLVLKDIYLSVVLEPYNGASVKFNTKLGYEQVFDVLAEDGMMRGVFYKAFNKSEIVIDKEIVINQYSMAIDLYKHEDVLNWSKMNHLFYVTGGFIVLFSFVFNIFEGIYLHLFLLVLSIIGMLVSFMFNVAIRSGIIYLQKRKDTVIEIERILIANKGVKVVSSDFGSYYRLFKKSPTTTIMQIIPKLLILLWLSLFVITAVIIFI